MDVRQLRHLLAVMECGSLSRAAAALSVSQPALTKSIQPLEEQLAVSFFHRDAHGMRPTIYAESLRAHAEKLDTGLRTAIDEIEALRSGVTGFVTIGASALTAGLVLPRAIAALQPCGRRYGCVWYPSMTIISKLSLRGEYDFLVKVLNEWEGGERVRQHVLFEDRLTFLVRKHHPLTRKEKLDFADLCAYG